jgi:hypothetical protein
MSGHTDTIRDYLAAQPEHALGLYPVRAALDALVAENQQLRDAIEEFLAPWGPEHYPQLRAALDGTP